jgi:bifunctional non-homologous end joining protein LigD
MHLDGVDVRRQFLSVRRSLLKHLIKDDEESRIQFSEEFGGDGAELFKACAEHGLEGIISKHALATYRSGRSKYLAQEQVFHRIDLC